MAQNFDGFRVGVADGDGLAFGFGQRQQLVELLVDGGCGAIIVEKDITGGGGDTLLPCQTSSEAFGAGQAVDEEEIALCLDALHQPVHGLLIGGEQAAHVIVDAHDIRQGLQAAKEGAEEFLATHADAQATLVQADLMQGLHGQVQDGLFVQASGFTQQALAVRCLGQDGVGNVARQPQGLQAPGLVIAQVVDDDGDADIGQERVAEAEQEQQEQAPVDGAG